jgi:hypothetical protein
MKFDKNKDDIKNINILKNEIKKVKNPYSKILIESLFNPSTSDEFRIIIKENVSNYIENKIKNNG